MPFPDLNPALLRALAARGYAEPTPVQAAVLEPGTVGRDLLVSAQTGSGKTVAFGLAIAAEVLGTAEHADRADGPHALVVAPTRELALQVRDELAWLYADAGGRVVACVGGTDIRGERRLLAGGAHIVVGTPGRLRDHLERENLVLGSLRAVVLDEADEMLDMGFRDELEAILDAAPAERRTLLFSATVPREIATLAAQYQRDALRIAATAEGEAHRDIEYKAIPVAPREAEAAVVNVLRWFEARGALVFCNTRETVARLHANLVERGFAAVTLSGELTQAERNRALQALRDRRARVLVATDVAARGIDLPDLGLVLHAELPRDRDTLLHRSGRTGRAGRKGTAVLLVPYNRRRIAERLLALARVRASWDKVPTAEAIRALDHTRLVDAAKAASAAEPDEEDLAIGRAVLAECGADAVAAALARVLRAPLPVPEEVEDIALLPEPRAGRARPAHADDGGEGGGGVWFRLSIGRNANADPRWLLPFLCRRGHLTRREVGRIRVLERETQVEIAPWAAGRFAAAARRPDQEEGDDIRIEQLHSPAPPQAQPQAPRLPQRTGGSAGRTSSRTRPRHRAA